MTNPYQNFFSKLDQTVEDLETDGGIERTHKDAADLLRRAGFVLANLLNVNAQVLPTLILPDVPDVVTGEADSEDHGTT